MASSFDSYVEHEMKADRDAIERLKRRYPDWEFVPVTGQLNIPVGPIHSAPNVEPLIKAVERLVRDNPLREWTSKGIYDALHAEGYPLNPPKSQRMANISTGIGKLCARPNSRVELVYRGSGRDPNRYKWRSVP